MKQTGTVKNTQDMHEYHREQANCHRASLCNSDVSRSQYSISQEETPPNAAVRQAEQRHGL